MKYIIGESMLLSARGLPKSHLPACIQHTADGDRCRNLSFWRKICRLWRNILLQMWHLAVLCYDSEYAMIAFM